MFLLSVSLCLEDCMSRFDSLVTVRGVFVNHLHELSISVGVKVHSHTVSFVMIHLALFDDIIFPRVYCQIDIHLPFILTSCSEEDV